MKLLRIEGVNLNHSILDTEDLATRRGGGLMLLNAINDINDIEVVTKGRLKKISTGASAGLFEIIGISEEEAREIVATALANPKRPYCYGTFVVDVHEDPNKDFLLAERMVVAKNRWQQMQKLSFSPFGIISTRVNKETPICIIDEVRPATTTTTVAAEKQQPVSASVKARREYGNDAKQDFYEKITETQYNNQFARNFDDIAIAPHQSVTPASLAGKIAVFYADGNGFGKIARNCKKAEDLTSWDNHIKTQRSKFLTELLQHAETQPHWKNNSVLRLETLLWGGDEFMLVVPAWCGLELAQRFIAFCERQEEYDNKTLTYACGLVFAHRQAPISRLTQLAMQLAEKSKENRSINAVNWLVLESFDHTGGGLDDYLQRQFGDRLKWQQQALTHSMLNAIHQQLPTLKDDLPRSNIVRIARMLATKENLSEEERQLLQRAYKQVGEAGGSIFEALWEALHPDQKAWKTPDLNPDTFKEDTNKEDTKNDFAVWIKLAELWDYCCGLSTDQTNNEGAQQ